MLPYTYRPLPDPSGQIRLLHVRQGFLDDSIECSLEVVSRQDAPKYIAISYTWGELLPVETIRVNGRSMIVRRNCYFALWQLRLHKFDMAVWVDSICIDQSNNNEKSSQVRLMGSVYARAELTAACIGEGLQLREVARDIANIDPESSNLSLGALFRYYEDFSDPDDLIRAWRNLYSLASIEYFKRLWIVQELYHSKHIAMFCGVDVLLWKDLEPFFLQVAEVTFKYASEHEGVLESLPELDETELARFIHFRKFRMAQMTAKTEWTDEITGHGFTGIILSFGEGKCYDPRDKIYGLLSLAQDRRWLVNFPVDYNRPLTSVLRDVVSRIGNESLTENCSRLIANMLRWFEIKPTNDAGQSLLTALGHSDVGPLVPWSNFIENVVTFESARVWQVSHLPAILPRHAMSLPHPMNAFVLLNNIMAKASFSWRKVCVLRGRIIQTYLEEFWIAGPEVRPNDFIVQFNAMRDEGDEHSTVFICRPLKTNSLRMNIVEQATSLVDLAAYDSIYETRYQQSRLSQNLSNVEQQYLQSRMLFARPHDDRITIHLRPFDLIKLVMLRGDIVDRIKHPVLSASSGCYTVRIHTDMAELAARTLTITTSQQPLTWSRVPTAER